MVGKMLLPHLGGAASVWTTCVLFFQTMLLLGYVYAHLLARVNDLRKQLVTHAVVLLLPLAFLPLRFTPGSSESLSQHPLRELLLLLTTSAAVPFFVVSTTSPLLQSWLARTKHAGASDPYFLYSASNAGSLLALICYPFLVEPQIGVSAQTELWFVGYLGLILLFALSSIALYRRPVSVTEQSVRNSVDPKTRLFWIAAAFVPSALMLAVTNHIGANVGSIPFLWLVPLAVYLSTFILAFARRFRVSAERTSRVVPIVFLIVFPLVTASVITPPGLNWLVIAAHIVLLFFGALLCHTRLGESRPPAEYLTEFYFWIALGGVLGGAFTATLAPVLFSTVLEYPLLVMTLPFFRIRTQDQFRVATPALFAVGIGTAWLILRATHLDSNTEAIALVHTAFVFAAYKSRKTALGFASGFAVLVLGYSLILPQYIDAADRVYTGRNFFGVKKVLDDPDMRIRKLLHGDTIHGMESTQSERAGQPLSYYYPGGSVSDIIDVLRSRKTRQRFAVIGLGAGSMAGYGDATHHVTFYEIDPSIEIIAREYFSFLPRCGANCDVVIGDGRLQLSREPDGTFDLLMLDAFSSDSVPTHLVSQEAMQTYLAKLAPGGILLFHVSNRYLDVEKLASALVSDAKLAAYSRFDDAGELRKAGKTSTQHVVAARDVADFEDLGNRPGWRPVGRPADFQTWTDDYSNLLSLIRWR
jgi:SAM-dependent methyltransferase